MLKNLQYGHWTLGGRLPFDHHPAFDKVGWDRVCSYHSCPAGEPVQDPSIQLTIIDLRFETTIGNDMHIYQLSVIYV